MSRTDVDSREPDGDTVGPGDLLEELRLPQQAGEKRFASLVQLLETAKGERLVRFAYATDGVARRGPVTLRRARPRAAARRAREASRARRRRCGCEAQRRSGEHERALARRVDERGEHQRAVAGAEQRVDRVLGVRHQAR